MFVTLVAVVCSADARNEIETSGKTRGSHFKARPPGLVSIPSHDTLSRFFSISDIGWPEERLRLWVDDICRGIPEMVATDGKTICDSPDKSSNSRNGVRSKPYMVSAWSVSKGICLGQRKVEEKSNEIKAIPELVKTLDFESRIVTIDAIGCQKSVTKPIIGNKVNYILCVKDNHEVLRNIIEFNPSEESRYYLCHAKRYFEENKGRGRSEYRECVCIGAKDLQYFLKGWTGIKTLVTVNSIRKMGDKEVVMETRHYISSLEPDPITILKSIRSYREVGNNLHWVLDIGFREDDDRKTGNAAINFFAVSKLALMLLKQNDIRLGMAGKRGVYGWDEKIRDKVVGTEKIQKMIRCYIYRASAL